MQPVRSFIVATALAACAVAHANTMTFGVVSNLSFSVEDLDPTDGVQPSYAADLKTWTHASWQNTPSTATGTWLGKSISSSETFGQSSSFAAIAGNTMAVSTHALPSELGTYFWSTAQLSGKVTLARKTALVLSGDLNFQFLPEDLRTDTGELWFSANWEGNNFRPVIVYTTERNQATTVSKHVRWSFENLANAEQTANLYVTLLSDARVVTAVPEPTSGALLATGLGCLLLVSRTALARRSCRHA